jgi:hypothetical protein
MSFSRLALVLGLMAWSPIHGQKIYVLPSTPTPAQGTTGTVYGHVLCGDTGRPARMATVVLQPVVAPPLPTSPTNSSTSRINQSAPTMVVQTLMDGSFTIPNVTPGDYYAIAELDGYVSALSLFSQDDLSHPTESMVKTMAPLVTPVTVSASSSSRADVTLVKGGTISGTVRFEDGMPDVDSLVVLQRQFPGHGVKNYYPTTHNRIDVDTDDQGHYRFAGLPEGDYKVFVILSVRNTQPIDTAEVHTSITTSTSTLSVYYGDTFGVSPKSISLKGAEDSVANIQIQLSKLHSVSGTVVDAASGAPVNSGTVTIVWPKGGDFGNDAQVTKTNVGEDGSFHFAFIPEGQFELKATNVRQTTPESGARPNGRVDAEVFARYRAAVKGSGPTYGDAQIPLIVRSDMTGVTLAVSPKALPGTTASSP